MCIPPQFLLFGVQAAASVAQGMASAQAANANAQIARYEGRQAIAAANLDAAKIRQRGRIVLGELAAAQASSGVSLTSGSAVDTAALSAANAELDAMTTVYGGEQRNWNAGIRASQSKAQAKSAMFNTLLGVGSSVVARGIQQDWFAPRTDTWSLGKSSIPQAGIWYGGKS